MTCWPALPLVLLVAFIVGCGIREVADSPPERIVLIVVDTLRADHLGIYGGSLKTPQFDALAERGQAFTNVVSSFHQTSMSMGGLFTGLTPSLESGDPQRSLAWNRGNRCGMARFRSAGDEGCLPRAVTTLAEDLKAAGYWTAGVTANPLLFRPAGYAQGFDHWREVGLIPGGSLRQQSKKEHAESRRGEHVNRAVAEVLAERPGDRFFLYVHFLDAHDWLLLRRSYARSVEIQDRLVGELLMDLDREGLLDYARVVLTSDHGEALGELHPLKARPGHLGNPSYEPVLRVPLIVAPPISLDVSAPFRGTDVAGLIRRIAGLESREPEIPREDFFLSEEQYRTYRKGRFKSIWPRNGRRELLFDLEADPGETRNRARRHPEVLARHRARIDELSRQLAHDRSVELDDADRTTDTERLRALGYIE
jgi:arylsulfatase A-like enzyme